MRGVHDLHARPVLEGCRICCCEVISLGHKSKKLKFVSHYGTCRRAAVGSSNNTFGIKGVEDYCFFFKSITNANELRRRMSECFERAALPHTSPQVHQVWAGLSNTQA